MNSNTMKKPRKHWIKLFLQTSKFRLKQSKTPDLINQSYNTIANDYDINWTNYIHELSEEMLSHLPAPKKAIAVDLTCGTGFVTGKLAELTDGNVTGVDASKGMLEVAQRNYGKKCKFVNSELMDFLNNQPSNSIDVVTCAWGLGYFPPTQVLKKVKRILHPKGVIGIIDHSRLSNAKMVKSAFHVFAENPSILKHVMKTYYLKNSRALALRMRFSGLNVLEAWDGANTFYEQDAKVVIDRLTKTGAAVGGIEFATDKKDQEKFYKRLAEIIQQRCGDEKGIPIKYRYLAVIGRKK